MDLTRIGYAVPITKYECEFETCDEKEEHYHCLNPDCYDNVVISGILHFHCSYPDCDHIFTREDKINEHSHCYILGCEYIFDVRNDEEHDHYLCCDKTEPHLHCPEIDCKIKKVHYHCSELDCDKHNKHMHCEVEYENGNICKVTKIHKHCNLQECENRVDYGQHDSEHCPRCGKYDEHLCCENCEFTLSKTYIDPVGDEVQLTTEKIFKAYNIHIETGHRVIHHRP